MTAQAYPLHWPPGFPKSKVREKGAFKTTLPGALGNVQDSLRKFSADSGKKLEGLVISSNYTLGSTSPQEPGVAVWFTWDGLGVCIAVDRYQKIEGNLQAIHHIIEARRVELRHGTLALVRASFAGFMALPDMSGGKSWQTVLGVAAGASAVEVSRAYKSLCSLYHPDKEGGSHEHMAEINRAYEEAKKWLSGGSS